ncbi:MAG: glycosyltransferase, partial [Methanobacterium sp.]|nr:glycosyltransferase [Methanobacterium sp.]
MKSTANKDDFNRFGNNTFNRSSQSNHPKLSDPNIYVVIPAYNESKLIGNVIEEIKPRNFNIIIVDDGSTDETYKIAQDSLKNYN